VLAYPGFAAAAGNSLVITVAATILAVALGVPAAWALARPAERHRAELLVASFLFARLVPPIALVIPFYVLASSVGLLDSALALILINATLALPLVVILMRQAFADLPQELEEAAAVDGAGPRRILVSIVLPLAAPAMVGTTLIVFAFVWNDYLFAVSLATVRMITLPVMVSSVGVSVREAAVGILICMSAPLVAVLLAQRWLISGLTLGAVRG
jgi:multiple sugar transport system permease protein